MRLSKQSGIWQLKNGVCAYRIRAIFGGFEWLWLFECVFFVVVEMKKKNTKTKHTKSSTFPQKTRIAFFRSSLFKHKPKLFSILKVFRIFHPCKQQLSNSNNNRKKNERFIRDRWDWLLHTVCNLLVFNILVSNFVRAVRMKKASFVVLPQPQPQTIAHISLIHAHIHT